MSSLGFFSSFAISNSSLRCSSLRSLFNLFSSRFSCFNRSFSLKRKSHTQILLDHYKCLQRLQLKFKKWSRCVYFNEQHCLSLAVKYIETIIHFTFRYFHTFLMVLGTELRVWHFLVFYHWSQAARPIFTLGTSK
jgi:WD40 repeat protein